MSDNQYLINRARQVIEGNMKPTPTIPQPEGEALLRRIRELESRLADPSVGDEGCAEIRAILNDAGVPAATFIDDHVRLLVAERDDLRARLATAEADALERAARWHDEQAEVAEELDIKKVASLHRDAAFDIRSLKPKADETKKAGE